MFGISPIYPDNGGLAGGSVPSGYYRDIVWVDLHVAPGGFGNEETPFNTANIGLNTVPDGGTLMLVGGDASTEPGINLGARSLNVIGLGALLPGGTVAPPALPNLTYAITSGAQRLCFERVSVNLTHSGTVAGLTQLFFEFCPVVQLTAGGDTCPVYCFGDRTCSFSGSGGTAHMRGVVVAGYVANGGGSVFLSNAHITSDVTSTTSITFHAGCTFGGAISITAPSISIDAASYKNAITAGVSFSSTPTSLIPFGTPVDIGTANAQGTSQLVAAANHVHNLPFSAVLAALALASTTINFNGQRLTGIAAPTSSTDATTKAYVDAAIVGLKVKTAAVAVATTNQATLSGTAQIIDGVALNTVGQRVLLTAQTTATQNGLWVVQSGAWTRPIDFATGSNATQSYVPISGGTTWGGSSYFCTNASGSDVVDTNNLTWTIFFLPASVVAGAGLTKTGNTLDVVAADATIVVNADSMQVGVIGNGNLADNTIALPRLVNATGQGHFLARNSSGSGAWEDVTTAQAQALLGIYASGSLKAVRAATTANITLSGTQTIDGVALVAGDRCLVKNQTTGSQNGVYSVASGSWTRSTDAAAAGQLYAGLCVPIGPEGTTQGKRVAMLTTADPITIGSTSLTFALDRIVPVASVAPQDVTDGAAQIGTAMDAARADHVHRLPYLAVAAVLAVASTAISVNSQKITSLATPTVSTDAANKGYVDSAISTAFTGFPAPANPADNGKFAYANAGSLAYASAVKTDGTYVALGSTPAVSGDIRGTYGFALKVGNHSGAGVPYALIQGAQVFGVDDSVLIGDNTAAKVESWVAATGSYVWRFNGTQALSVSANGLAFTQQAVSSGTAPVVLSVSGAAHTGLTASSEPRDVTFGLTRTVTLATGDIALTRAMRITAPIYAFAGASTVAMAATVSIASPPSPGTNATITNPLALLIENGAIGLSTSAAQSGLLRGPGNSLLLAARGTASSIDVPVASVDASDHLVLGGSGTNSPSTNYYNTRSGGSHIWQVNATDVASLSSSIFDFKSLAAKFGNGASAGTIRLQNDVGLITWNGVGSLAGSNVLGIYLDSSNAILIGAPNGGYVSPANAAIYSNAAGAVILRNGTNNSFLTAAGGSAITQVAATSGTAPVAFTVTGAAHTGLTASTEPRDVTFALNRTVTMSAGALASARAVYFRAPTYAFAGASTLTTAATVAISGAPAAGSNATITRGYALLIDAGAIGFGSTPSINAALNFSSSNTVLLGAKDGTSTDRALVTWSSANLLTLGVSSVTTQIVAGGGTWQFGSSGTFPGVEHNIASGGYISSTGTHAASGFIRGPVASTLIASKHPTSGDIAVVATNGSGEVLLGSNAAANAYVTSGGNVFVQPAGDMFIEAGGGATEWRFGTTGHFPAVEHNMAAGGYWSFGTTAASSGTLAFSYGEALLASRNKANSGDRSLLFFGLEGGTEDSLIMGDSGVRTIKYRNQSGPHQFEVGGSVVLSLGTAATWFSDTNMNNHSLTSVSFESVNQYIEISATTAPSAPGTTGWRIYCDSADGRLKAKPVSGPPVTLA